MTDGKQGPPTRAAHLEATVRRRAAVHAAVGRTLSPRLLPDLGTVLDVAWSNPTAAQIRAAGAVGVIGYFSLDTTKNLTPAQVAGYRAAAMPCAPVWETTAGRALAGYAAGQADARNAATQRSACGMPTGQKIRFAVDTDTTWASVSPYFEGAASVIGKANTAPYGGYAITTAAYAAGYRGCWQTVAWSQGSTDPHAVLYQTGHTALGGDADVNTILAADWGQYPPLEDTVTLTATDMDALINHPMPGYADVPDSSGKPYNPTIGEVWNGSKQADGKVDALAKDLGTFASAAKSSLATILSQVQTNGSNGTAANTALSALAAKLDALTAAVAQLGATGITDAQADALANKIVADLAARLQA